MTNSRLLRWLVTASMTAVTVVMLFTAVELGVVAVVAYLVYRVAKLSLVLWGMNLLQRRRRTALAPA